MPTHNVPNKVLSHKHADHSIRYAQEVQIIADWQGTYSDDLPVSKGQKVWLVENVTKFLEHKEIRQLKRDIQNIEGEIEEVEGDGANMQDLHDKKHEKEQLLQRRQQHLDVNLLEEAIMQLEREIKKLDKKINDLKRQGKDTGFCTEQRNQVLKNMQEKQADLDSSGTAGFYTNKILTQVQNQQGMSLVSCNIQFGFVPTYLLRSKSLTLPEIKSRMKECDSSLPTPAATVKLNDGTEYRLSGSAHIHNHSGEFNSGEIIYKNDKYYHQIIFTQPELQDDLNLKKKSTKTTFNSMTPAEKNSFQQRINNHISNNHLHAVVIDLDTGDSKWFKKEHRQIETPAGCFLWGPAASTTTQWKSIGDAGYEPFLLNNIHDWQDNFSMNHEIKEINHLTRQIAEYEGDSTELVQRKQELEENVRQSPGYSQAMQCDGVWKWTFGIERRNWWIGDDAIN